MIDLRNVSLLVKLYMDTYEYEFSNWNNELLFAKKLKDK